MGVSRHILVSRTVDTSMLATSNMGRREYKVNDYTLNKD
jgi:hypothetical protein